MTWAVASRPSSTPSSWAARWPTALLTPDIAAGYDEARRRGAGGRTGPAADAVAGRRAAAAEPAVGAAVPPSPLLRQPAPDAARAPPRDGVAPAAAGDRLRGADPRRRVRARATAPPSTSQGERRRVEQAVAEMVALGPGPARLAGDADAASAARSACATATTTCCTTSATATSRPTARACCTSRTTTASKAEVDGTELANLLADQTSLRLVVLNSCEGARTTLTDPYAGVATTLVQLGVPAVVAMQFEISDEAAILFAVRAVHEPHRPPGPDRRRRRRGPQGHLHRAAATVEWATPVLFMGDVDVELFHFEVAAAPLPPPPPPELGDRRRAATPCRRRHPAPAPTAGRRAAPARRLDRRQGRSPASACVARAAAARRLHHRRRRRAHRRDRRRRRRRDHAGDRGRATGADDVIARAW